MANAPGLMDSTALTPPGGTGAPAPQGDDDGDEGQAASQQEEAQMEQFLAQCKLAIYNPKHPEATQALIAQLKTGDPVQALAHAAVNVVMRVESAAEQAGQKLDPAVLLQGGYAVVDDIAKFSGQVTKQQGTPTYNDRQIQAAYLQAVDLYRTMKQQSGQLDQGAAQQEWGALKQANQSGNLGSVLPGANDLKPGAGDDGAPASAAPPGPAAPPPGLAKRKKRRR